MNYINSTNEASPQPLKCFQHCSRDANLICFNVPYVCPLCNQYTAHTESRIPPYILPSPFTSSEKCIRSVVLRPTHGDFICNYVQTCNLHIGVADKNGHVYDFDEKGLKYGPPWPECLAVQFGGIAPSLWDSCLSKAVSNAEMWKALRYNEEKWNCFDFVLYFMKHLATYGEGLQEFSKMARDEFSTLFLTSKTKKAEQYIHLYRQVMTVGCVSVSNQDAPYT